MNFFARITNRQTSALRARFARNTVRLNR
jgi:hypothetical protein